MMLPILHATSDEGAGLIRQARNAVPGLVMLSLARAVLMLAPAFYLLLLFDSALPGHSLSSVFSLSGLVLLVLAGWAGLGWLRRAMLVHVGLMAQQRIVPRLDAATARLAESGGSDAGDETQIARDLDALGQFLIDGGAELVLDGASLLPVALVMLLVLQGWFALVALAGVLVLAVLLRQTLRREAGFAEQALSLIGRRHGMMETSRGHAEALRALGMGAVAGQAWALVNNGLWRLAIERGGQGALWALAARGVQMVAVLALLVIGAGLTLSGGASVAVSLAAAALGWLALEPWARGIAQAGAFAAAARGWARLDKVLAAVPAPVAAMPLAPPAARLVCEAVAIVPPGRRKPVLSGVNWTLEAGQAVAMIGPGGGGKSAMLRALVGAWEPASGAVRLDGAALTQWDRQALARHIGYLPQGVDLLDGTVAENIARFDPAPDPQAIIAAAREAGVHDMILRLPEGYATNVGRHGRRLSASEAQRIGLARALFGQPFLIALDEPTAHLDTPARAQLAASLSAARARGAVVVLAGAAGELMTMASHALILRDGAMAWFGEKEQLQQHARAAQAKAAVSKVTS